MDLITIILMVMQSLGMITGDSVKDNNTANIIAKENPSALQDHKLCIDGGFVYIDPTSE